MSGFVIEIQEVGVQPAPRGALGGHTDKGTLEVVARPIARLVRDRGLIQLDAKIGPFTALDRESKAQDHAIDVAAKAGQASSVNSRPLSGVPSHWNSGSSAPGAKPVGPLSGAKRCSRRSGAGVVAASTQPPWARRGNSPGFQISFWIAVSRPSCERRASSS